MLVVNATNDALEFIDIPNPDLSAYATIVYVDSQLALKQDNLLGLPHTGENDILYINANN